MKKKFSFFSPSISFVWQLFNDLLQVWNSLQDGVSELKDAFDIRQTLLRNSRLYRAALGAHIGELDVCVKESRDPIWVIPGTLPDDIAKEYRKASKRISEYHVIFYLCEILFLSSVPEQTVTGQLLDWIHMTFYPNVTVLKELESGSVEYEAVEEEVWKILIAFIVQGCIREAGLCLEIVAHHEKSMEESKYLKVIGALLLELPMVGASTSIREMMPRFNQWKQKCSHLLQNTKREKCERSTELLEIITGNEQRLVTSCSWVELVIANLLYADPSQKRYHLRELVQRCVALKRFNIPDMPPYQRILYAVFTEDVVLALNLSAQFTQSWFPAHLADLLFHSGALPEEDAGRMRFSMVFAHVDALRNSQDHWAALQYLRYLESADARALMVNVLENIPLTSEKVVVRVHSTCISLNQPRSASFVAQSWAMKRWQDGIYFDALEWAKLAELHAPRLLPRMVVAITKGKTGNEGLKGLDDLLAHANNLEPNVSLFSPELASSPSLRFVSTYLQLQQARSSGDLKGAAEALKKLVADKVSPRSFWLALLEQCIALFEESSPLFSLTELHALMSRLNSVLVTKDGAVQEGKVLQTLQLAMVRGAARNMMIGKH